MDSNRSLDISELMSRIHKQAVLVGGPHDGKRAPLPPMIYEGEHPKYLCQPGRPFDQTHYHYQLTTDTTYVYVDHCDTLPGWPHHPAEIDDEKERTHSGRALLVACLAVVFGLSGLIMGLVINAVVRWVLD